MNVVLLSTSKDRVDAIRAASRRRGFICTVVPDDQHASAAIQQSGEGILILDAESTNDLERILRGRSPNWPILVLSARFDSSAWVELFKAGASEVIGDPLDARKVDAALDGFAGDRTDQSPVRSLWRSVARKLGLWSSP